MEVQPGLGMSGEEVRARGTAVKLPEKGLCLHWPMTQLAHLSLEQEVNTASFEIAQTHPWEALVAQQ